MAFGNRDKRHYFGPLNRSEKARKKQAKKGRGKRKKRIKR